MVKTGMMAGTCPLAPHHQIQPNANAPYLLIYYFLLFQVKRLNYP